MISTIPMFAIAFVLRCVDASPLLLWHARQNSPSSPTDGSPTDGSNPFSSMSTQIWLPVVVIAILGFVLLITLCRKRPGTVSTPAQQVSADQSAESANGSVPGRTGRSRRPRRTPSQISTRSLPAYMKEPGDQELVIYRALPEMEDARLLPATVVLPSVNEQGPLHSRNNSDTSPLLQHHDDQPESAIQQNPRSLRRSRREPASASLNTPDNPEIINGSGNIDPRGEAPPYVEVDGTSAATLNEQGSNSYPPPPIPPPSAGGDGATNSNQETRRSGFRKILNALSHPGPRLPAPLNARIPGNGHARSLSTDTSNTMDSSTPLRSTHERSSSSSTNESAFGPVSRQQSNNTMNSSRSHRMTSSSQISLNSISAPLSYTLVRTEFTYPKAGLTPDQLKLISSRDSLGKFGIPYGPDAVAYASSSRQDFLPPPDFDAPSTSSLSRLGQEVYTAPSPSPPPPVASVSSNRPSFNRVLSRPSQRLPRGITIERAGGSEGGNQDMQPSSVQVTTVPSSNDIDASQGVTSVTLLPPVRTNSPLSFKFPSDAHAVDHLMSRPSITYSTAQESLHTISDSGSTSTPRDGDSQI